MTNTDRVIDWIIKSDDANKYEITVAEKKLFGITIYKKITIFQDMMKDSGEVINLEQKEVSDRLRKFNESKYKDKP
ncbi:MAG: hypothetical protein ACHQ1D_04810 [Nitrososphaerales archaeon]